MTEPTVRRPAIIERPWPPLDVDVWRIRLDAPRGQLENGLQVLGQEEFARAARFVDPAERRQYVVAHAALRDVLSSYVGTPASALQFRWERLGRPRLARERVDIQFSFSRSSDLAVVAVCTDHAVGVDVEKVVPGFEYEPILRNFGIGVAEELMTKLAEPERTRHFFSSWVRLEALLKAKGVGLYGLRDRQPNTSSDVESTETWSVVDLLVADDYCAAVASEGGLDRLHFRDYMPLDAKGVTT